MGLICCKPLFCLQNIPIPGFRQLHSFYSSRFREPDGGDSNKSRLFRPLCRQQLIHIPMKDFYILFRIISSGYPGLIGDHHQLKSGLLKPSQSFPAPRLADAYPPDGADNLPLHSACRPGPKIQFFHISFLLTDQRYRSYLAYGPLPDRTSSAPRLPPSSGLRAVQKFQSASWPPACSIRAATLWRTLYGQYMRR